MPSYDKGFRPAAPVVLARIMKPSDEKEERVRALLDSGASISVVPEAIIAGLGLVPETSIPVKAYDGTRKSQDGYYLNVAIDDRIFEDVKAVGTKQDTALIGRNILNELTVILEGKEERFEIEDPDQ